MRYESYLDFLGKCFNEQDEFRGTVLKVGENTKEMANLWLYC